MNSLLEYSLENAYIKELTELRKIEVGIGSRTYRMCITELYMLHQRLNKINIEVYFNNLSDEYDSFKITLPKHKVADNLTVAEMCRLKEIVAQMIFLYELDAILKKNNICVGVAATNTDVAFVQQ